jgi:hypothetical protein
MEKRIVLHDGEFAASDKEKHVTPFVLTKYGHEIDNRLSKTYACDEALEYASLLKPIPDYRIILVTAMGCTEYWDENKKGDTFPLAALMGRYPDDVPKSFFDRVKSRIPKEWGMQTFPTKYNTQGIQIGGGNTFHEHCNRIPPDLMGKEIDYSLSREPRCGFIIKSFWNKKYHRVEIIQTVSIKKQPAIVKRIDNGELIGISMACDVGFDRCMKCGNLATSASTYCRHLSNKMLRGLIDKFGDLYAMINDFPYFFDSTLTERPADYNGMMIVKVAFNSDYAFVSDNEPWHFGNDYQPNSFSKSANFSDLDSHVRLRHKNDLGLDNQDGFLLHDLSSHRLINGIKNHLSDYRQSEHALPVSVVRALRKIAYHNLMIYLTILSINPTDEDLANLMFDLPEKGNQSKLISQEIANLNSNPVPYISKNANDISLLKRNISVAKESDPNLVEFREVCKTLSPYMEQKSYDPDYLLQRPLKKSASINREHMVSPEELSQRAQSVLLTRLVTEPDLLEQISTFLSSPLIKAELIRQGIEFNNTNSEIVKSILDSNINRDRQELYN